MNATRLFASLLLAGCAKQSAAPAPEPIPEEWLTEVSRRIDAGDRSGASALAQQVMESVEQAPRERAVAGFISTSVWAGDPETETQLLSAMDAFLAVADALPLETPITDTVTLFDARREGRHLAALLRLQADASFADGADDAVRVSGVSDEYRLLTEARCGEGAWTVTGQSLVRREGRPYDVLTAECSTDAAQTRDFWFDIAEWQHLMAFAMGEASLPPGFTEELARQVLMGEMAGPAK